MSTNDSALVGIMVPRNVVLTTFESGIGFILSVTALAGNVLVCLAFYRNPCLRTITNVFILSLAITDLLMAALIMPLTTASSVANRAVAGDYGCRISSFVGYVLVGTSILTVMLLAVNRYIRVVRPSMYRKIYSKQRSALMVAIAWIITILFGIVAYTVAGLSFRLSPRCLPVFLNKTALFLYIGIKGGYLILSSLVVILCYVRIYQTIHRHNTAISHSSLEGTSAYGVEEAKTTRLLTVVLAGFYICWIPVVITSILEILDVIGKKYHIFYNNFPAYFSSALNPIIYATMNQSFKLEFLKIIRGH